MRSVRTLTLILWLIFLGFPLFSQANMVPVSLIVNGIPQGDVEAQIELSDVSLPTALVIRVLQPILAEEYFKAISGAETKNLRLSDLRFLGLEANFDSQNLIIRLQVPSHFMKEKPLQPDSARSSRAATTVGPAPLSAFANGVFNLGIQKDPEFSPYLILNTNVDGAVNLRGWVTEAEGSLSMKELTTVELRNLQEVYDYRPWGVRFAAGTVDLPQTGFQGRLNLAGVTVGSNPDALLKTGTPSPAEPKRNRILGDLDLIEVNNPAKISIKTNGITVRSETVGPGKYRIGNLPLASGLNDVVIRIEEEGKPPIERRLGIAYDGALLQRGDYRFALGLGADTAETSRLTESGLFRYGIFEALEGGANIQNGLGVLLGGLSLKAATILGFFYGDGAASYPYSDSDSEFPASLGYSGSIQYRLGFPAHPFFPRFGLGFQYATANFSIPQLAPTTAPLGPPWRVSAQVAQATPVGIALALMGDYGSSDGRTRVFGTAFGLSATLGTGISLSASLSMDNRLGYLVPQASLSLLIIPGDGKTVTHYYQSLTDGEAGAELGWNTGNKTGDYNGTVGITNPLGPPNSPGTFSGSLKRIGSIGDLSSAFWYRDNRDGLGPSYGGTLGAEGAWVYADGVGAPSRRVYDSFAILQPDGTLKAEIVEMNTGASSKVQSQGGKPVVLPNLSAYKATSASIILPQAPADVTSKTPFITLEPAYKSGLVVKPSRSKTILVTGTLEDSQGKPVPWTLGTLMGPQGSEIFTDEEGYFEAYVTDEGTYTINWHTEVPFTMNFTLPKGTEGPFPLGKVSQTSGGKTTP